MPARNSRKSYLENGHYHLYNRGVEKRHIFLDDQDREVFLSYLQEYLLPKDTSALQQKIADPTTHYKEKDKLTKQLRRNNFSDDITLLAYCLMPNHFHFFIKQKSAGGIDKFMNSLGTRYSMYFNKKYKRVGPLFQGVYKAAPVTNETQFVYLTKYIHKQALAPSNGTIDSSKHPSSYDDYLGKRTTSWLKSDEITSYYSQNNQLLSYRAFVEEVSEFPDLAHILMEACDTSSLSMYNPTLKTKMRGLVKQ